MCIATLKKFKSFEFKEWHKKWRNLKLILCEISEHRETNAKESLKKMLSEKALRGSNKKYFNFTTDAMQTIFLYAFYANSHQAPELWRWARQKREVFKLLCDERVPRNIVYVMTISIMKHQLQLEKWPRGRQDVRKGNLATDLVRSRKRKKENSMSFIANNIIVVACSSMDLLTLSFLPRWW